MTAMSTLVPALKRELAIPGTFDDLFPDTGTNDLIGSLADAYSQAKLDGWFKDVVLDTEAFTTTPDLSEAGGAVVVIYASTRFIRSQLRAITSNETYKAGSVEYSVSHPASLLKAELDFLQQRLKDIVSNAQRAARTCTAMVFDGYLQRTSAGDWGGGGFYPYEYDYAFGGSTYFPYEYRA